MKIILSGNDVKKILEEWAMRVHGLSCDVDFRSSYNELHEANLTNNARAAENEPEKKIAIECIAPKPAPGSLVNKLDDSEPL